jgi:hypothetical protein
MSTSAGKRRSGGKSQSRDWRALERWHRIRLVLTNYLARIWPAGIVLAVLYLIIVFLWMLSNAFAKDLATARAAVGTLFYSLAMLPQSLVSMDADRRVLGTLPMSRGDRGLAVWAQMTVLPFGLCMALSLPAAFLHLVVGHSFFSAAESWLLLMMVGAASFSAWVLWPACVQPLVRRLGATGLAGYLGWVVVLLLTGQLVLGGALLCWTMATLPLHWAMLAFTGTAMLFSCVALLRRNNLDIPWRGVVAETKRGGNAGSIPSIFPNRWRSRQAPWLSALKLGVAFSLLVVSAAICKIVLPSSRSVNSGFLFVMPLLLGMIGHLLWVPSLRALRMLPASMDRIVRMLISVQLALTLPSVVLVCITSAAWAASTGDIITPSKAVGAALCGEAMVLLAAPLCFQYWEIAAMAAFGGAIFVQAPFEEMLKSAGEILGRAIIVLPPLAAIAAVAALFVCVHGIRRFLAADTRAYIKRSVFVLWRAW